MTRPQNKFRPSAQLIDLPVGHLWKNVVIPSMDLFLDLQDPCGLQIISNLGVLPLSVIHTTSRHSCNLPGCPVMETLQHFQHCSHHHPTILPYSSTIYVTALYSFPRSITVAPVFISTFNITPQCCRAFCRLWYIAAQSLLWYVMVRPR